MDGKKGGEVGQMGCIHANNPSASTQHLALLCRRREAASSRWTVGASAQSKLCYFVDFIDEFFLY